jgi:hypothetical protein
MQKVVSLIGMGGPTMFHHRARISGWLILALGLLGLCGCGGDDNKLAALSGTVTYDGAAIERGYISFYPTDEHGSSAGAEITNGQYSIKGLVPGKKRVMITAITLPATPPAPVGGRSGAQAERLQARKKQKTAGTAPSGNAVPENAVGNNQVVDIPAGAQTRDFALQKPAAAAKKK